MSMGSLPDGAEYWNDVKAHFGRTRYSEPKLHAPAPGVTLEPRPGNDNQPMWKTACGEMLARDRLRNKASKVTCRGCLAQIRRFVVTHEVGGVVKILLATDDVNEAQEKYYEAVDNKLKAVTLTDKQAPK